MKIDTNTILSAVAIGLLTWVGTTLNNVDKSVAVMQYQIEEMQKQTFHEDCAFCNHHKHAELGWGK